MQNSKYKIQNSNSGFALVTVLFVLIILLAIGTLFISISNYEARVSNNFRNSTKAFYLAESGLEKAIWSLNQTQSTYAGETNTLLEGGKFTTTIINDPSNPNNRIITSTGYFPAGVIYPAKRTVQVTATANSSDQSVAFHYAVQIGDLGLSMSSNSTINGNVYSNGNITGSSNSQINGDAYAVGTISSPRPVISGTTHPNSQIQPLPTIDTGFWETQANINSNPYVGDMTINSNGSTLGPKEIQGNLTLNSGSSLIVTGPIYVTGNFVMNSNSNVSLSQTFGSKGTVIIVDGSILINSNTTISTTTANPKGYIMFVSTNTSSSANEIQSNAAGGIFYSLNGGIQIASNGYAVSVAGRSLTLNSNATLNYDVGLASEVFTSGPGGSWIKKSSTWKEIY
jgi:Tfp pilus assembly protein PilX